ncbi:MAG: Gfo/Idh/MocA family oxidoreductase [Bradyrhizobiaceae bacterium]|nr:Gfo/Idh/MocA family oxidoreductase [Bradyrhizobiaceae bacterium]
MKEPLQLGIIGLGRAFTIMLPTLSKHPLIRLVAACDPRADARERFVADFQAATYQTAEELCADPSVQAVYVASPHQFHVEHVTLAARCGKHVLVEKPMALTVADCRAMIEAAKRSGIHLLVGHSHSYDLPYLRTREMIRTGAYGRVRMVSALNFTDFLYRPRRPEELDTNAGGGVVFSQAAHQVDVVRLLIGSRAMTVRAFTGRWDPVRPTEGAYTAQIAFEDGAFASLTYSGYGRFDTDEFMGWLGELGHIRDPDVYGSSRALLRTVRTAEEEEWLKNRHAYGPAGKEAYQSGGLSHNHFGLIIVSCELADLRPLPQGVLVYGDNDRRMEKLAPPDVPRSEVVDELYASVVLGERPQHSGEWGLATLEICLAILESSAKGRHVVLQHQIC